jgi:deoxyuridine 5'-triphosphate nucleotidohydrolase
MLKLSTNQNINNDVFKPVNFNTQEKAYFLGLFHSAGEIDGEGELETLCIYVKTENHFGIENIFADLMKNIFNYRAFISNAIGGSSFVLKDRGVIQDIAKLSQKDVKNEFFNDYCRGLFEGYCIPIDRKHMNCDISVFPEEVLKRFYGDNIPRNLKLSPINTLDFLGRLYDNIGLCPLLYQSNFSIYKEMLEYDNTKYGNMWFKFKRHDGAFKPFKQNVSDSGYDLTLIKLDKKDGDVEFYDTGISIEPSFNYYFDLVGRSSISKSGYMLANNVGIIDRSYRGTIKVPLIKLNKDKPDLVLPCRLVQIIPRKIQHLQAIEEDIEMTSRGFGSFGSTGN